MVAFKLITPPAVEPVTLADAKLQARLSDATDDALLTNLIVAARQWVEHYTNRALITQTWQMAVDTYALADSPWWDGVREGPVSAFTSKGFLALPHAPLQSVTAVQTFDDTDTGTVWPSSNYFVDTLREPGRLTLRVGAVWPVPTRLANGIVVTYVAGYGDNGTSVPEVIKTALRALVAHWYENRNVMAEMRNLAKTIPLTVEALLMPFRVQCLGG